MNSVSELLPEWAWVLLLISLSFTFFMLSLGFVIKTAIEKALGGNLKQINDAINELQHIRDDLKMLRKLDKLDKLELLTQLEKLDTLDVLTNSWLLNSKFLS